MLAQIIMKKFLHMSDVHLGNQQYGLKERFNDFGEAYFNAVDCAIEEQVDFVLISGDLFDKPRVDPLTLTQAVEGLKRLKAKGIQVLAINGNHDRSHYQDNFSWPEFLAEQEYLMLLSPEFTESEPRLMPYNGTSGSYFDIGGVRIFGLPYLGASTGPMMEEMPTLIAGLEKKSVQFTILMAHFGLDGQLPGTPGGLPPNALNNLQEMVDYLALGHWHKPYEEAGWIFNPGSLECCGMDERNWHGGFYLVSIPEKSGETFSARHVQINRRLFHRIVFPVEGRNTPLELRTALNTVLTADKKSLGKQEKPPIIELVLEGILAFDRQMLELEAIQELMQNIFEPVLFTKVVNNTRSTRFDISPVEVLPRIELERHILRELLLGDGRFSPRVDHWLAAALEVKELANMKSDPETIIKALRKVVDQHGQEA